VGAGGLSFDRGEEGGEGGGDPAVESFGNGSIGGRGDTLVFKSFFPDGPVSVFPRCSGPGRVWGGGL